MKEGCKEGIVQFVEKNMACMFYHEVQSSQAIQGAYNIVGDILLNGFLTKKINVNWVYDKTQTNSHNWVAIVIRNLPPTVSSQIIQRNCSDEAIAKYALTPINIKGNIIISSYSINYIYIYIYMFYGIFLGFGFGYALQVFQKFWDRRRKLVSCGKLISIYIFTCTYTYLYPVYVNVAYYI